MEPQPAWRELLSSFPDFRHFLLGRFLVTISVQIQTVVVGWQVYDLTGDPLSLGLIGLCEAVPHLGVALIAGYVADIFPRRSIVLFCVMGLTTCSLSLLTIALVQPAAHITILLLYATIAFSGFARGFYAPAAFSWMAQMVPPHHYPTSSSLGSGTWQLAAMSGPAIGGLLYGYFDLESAYLADFLLASLALLVFAFTGPYPVAGARRTGSVASTMLEGVRFVWKTRPVLGAISLDLFAVLFGGAVALLPVYAKDILHCGPEGLGLLRAAPAVGALAMAFVLAARPPIHRTGRKMLWSVFAFGLCMLAFGISTNFYLSLGLLLLSGAFDNVSVVVRSMTMQMLTPDSMRGKVAAVNTIFIGASNEIGAFESGVTARWMGTVPAVVFGAGMTLVVVVVASFLFSDLRRLEFKESGQRDST